MTVAHGSYIVCVMKGLSGNFVRRFQLALLEFLFEPDISETHRRSSLRPEEMAQVVRQSGFDL